MFYHLVHRTVLKEHTVLVTILTIVIVGVAVSICATVLFASQWHTATLTELRQLPLLKCFLLRGECSLVGLESLWILVGHEIALGRTIGCLGDAVGMKPTWCEFLGEKVGHRGISSLSVIMDAHLTGEAETCVLVKLDVSLHAEEADTQLSCFLQRILEQLQSIALTFVVGVDADGAECP